MIAPAPGIPSTGAAHGPHAEAPVPQSGLDAGGTKDGVYTMCRDLQALLGRLRERENDRRMIEPVNRERNR